VSLSRAQAEARRVQARQDLAELEVQVVDGELDAVTAGMLRDLYQEELEAAESAFASAHDHEGGVSSPRRWLVVFLVVLVVVAAVVISVSGFTRVRAPGAPVTGGFEGVARAGFDQTVADFDASAYSDEVLEAVVAANSDSPEIAGMRLALADRYFSKGDYQAAFPHYQAVLETEPEPTPGLLAAALSRLGWIVYSGNGEVDLALGLLDSALELRPGDPYPTYLKALVLWCGVGDADQAVGLLRVVVASESIGEKARTVVEDDLASASGGEACR
jgi:cytochrome c-type biogenesis protein CcmH/NrfG